MGIASLFMPAIAGIIADKWINAEKLYGIFHFAGGMLLLILPGINDPRLFFWVMLLTMMFYMPTIGLSITIAYTALKMNQYNIVKSYPPIRVWGTVGFIVALWVVSLSGFETNSGQFYIAAGSSFLLGVYAFTLPHCPPMGKGHRPNLASALGLMLLPFSKAGRWPLFSFLPCSWVPPCNLPMPTGIPFFMTLPKFRNLPIWSP